MESEVFFFWAKTDKKDGNDSWHHLLWHLLDAGIVTQHLWDLALADNFKSTMAQALSLSEEQARNLLAFWVALHDIGKAGPAFQRKWEPGKIRLQQAGLKFPNSPHELPGYHGHATAWILEAYFDETYSREQRYFKQLAQAIGGHHGTLPTSREMVVLSIYKTDHLGDAAWTKAREYLFERLKTVFSPQLSFSIPQDKEQLNALLILVAGLTTTADWIASNSVYFHFDDGSMPLNAYIDQSRKEAVTALQELGWGTWKAEDRPLTFHEIFPAFQPNSLQSAFIRETDSLQSPFLVILEAPTGSGKTESALYLADTTLQRKHQAGMYIAMPSQATSNQMFERTTRFISTRHAHDTLNVQLIHGASVINEFYQKVRLQGISQDEGQTNGNIGAAEWFLPRKKSLLAPFGVGTVDQAFLSVLCSKHFFLRLFGLANKIVIFDEVHAYDVYMLEIFKRLLQWLRAINTSVILLSATLPQQSRAELLQAYSDDVPQKLPEVPFPRISSSTSHRVHVTPLGEVPSRSIGLHWMDETNLVQTLQDQLCEGGNAAILCNRVDQAIEIYQYLQDVFPAGELTLFHSRFPYCWREQIENKVLQRYGKKSANRPQRSIVVATQVIEQSLDLDFDVMFSSLAPVDMLIQRAGRLQRHREAASPPQRPDKLRDPKFFIFRPNLEAPLPAFGNDRFIYEAYLLQRTWYALRDRQVLLLPADTDELIEKVYSDQFIDEIPSDVWPEIQKHFEQMMHKNDKEALSAKGQLIPAPQRNILGKISTFLKEENDPQSLSVMHVLTRNARPSVQVICLIRDGDRIYTLNGHHPLNLEQKPDEAATKACLRSAVTFSQRQIVNFFFSQPVPAGWKQSAALRSHFAAEFSNTLFQAEGYQLTLSPEMGIIISSEQSEKED